MSDEVEFVKKEIILWFVSINADEGNVLNLQPFARKQMQTWNPKQKDALETAANELASEGFLEDRDGSFFLTEKAVEEIYPIVGSSVRDDILSFFSECNSRAGHALNARAFWTKRMQTWNPKQKAAFDSVTQELEADGLIEKKGEDIFLTEKGYDAIY